MNWRWLLLDYVDPDLEVSRLTRRQIRVEAWKQMRSGWKSLPDAARPSKLVTVISALVPAAGVIVAYTPWVLISGFAGGFIVPKLLGQVVVTWLGIALMGRWTWRPAVLMALRQHGYEVCFGCGYWLRGLEETTEVCPECGRERDVMPPSTCDTQLP